MFRLTFLGILLSYSLAGQDGQYNFGAPHHGLSGASVTLTDSWALFNNPGALNNKAQTAIALGYQNRYNIGDLNSLAGAFIWHQPNLNIGLKVFRFGGSLFNQQLLGLALANQIDMVSFGIGINYLQSQIEGIGTQGKWLVEAGMLTTWNDKISLGFHLFNLKHATDHPLIMKAGIGISPVKSLSLLTQITKQADKPTKLSAAISYELISQLLFRIGLSGNHGPSNPNIRSSYGLGLTLGQITVDYSMTSHESLGLQHDISLVFQIKKS